MMQKFLHSDPLSVKRDIERYLEAGWRVVPGTVEMWSVEQVADPQTYPTTPNKTYFRLYMCAVVEKAEASEKAN